MASHASAVRARGFPARCTNLGSDAPLMAASTANNKAADSAALLFMRAEPLPAYAWYGLAG